MDIKYFDNAATTRVKSEVLEEMLPYLKEKFGNPSSMYSVGRETKKAIEKARERVASLINCNPNEIYFTGSGSESDNTAIKGIAYKNGYRKRHIITTKIEHPAVLHTCQFLAKQGYAITYLNVNQDGIVDLDELKNSIRHDTMLISIMFANNEIGTIQPISQIAKIAKMYYIVFHTDSVQACGNVPIDVKRMGIDMLSLSGHKIYAPKGIGALYVRNGIEFEKFIDGGHQERNKRGGTENVAGIVGLGKACELAKQGLNQHIKHLQEMRDYYILKVKENVPNVRLNGTLEHRLPGNANFSFEGVKGEDLLLNLDAKGICASSGSACSTRFTKSFACIISNRAYNKSSLFSFTYHLWRRKHQRRYRLSSSKLKRNSRKIEKNQSSKIAIAHFIPSTAADIIPPAYPAPSPQG